MYLGIEPYIVCCNMSSIFSLSGSHTILVFNKASSGLSATAELLVLFEYIGSGR